MKQYQVLVKKEWKQFFKEWKVIWLPMVFILLGIMQPIAVYYLPFLMDLVGEEEGVTIDLSAMEQTSSEIFAGTLSSQFDQLGLIVIAVSIMGMIQIDKKDGMLDIILTKPVGVKNYVLSKYTSYWLLVLFSIAIGYLTSYGYTVFLFESIPIQNVLLGFVYYALWIAFIVAFVLLMSSIVKQTALLAIGSIGILFILRAMNGWNDLIDLILPSSLSYEAINQMITGQSSEILIHIVVIILWSILLLYLSVQKLRIRNA